MTIEQRREACARFEEYFIAEEFWDGTSICTSGCHKGSYCKPYYGDDCLDCNWEFVCDVPDYHPDLDDPTSREQANELWKKLEKDGMQCDVESWTNPDHVLFKICVVKCKFRHWYIKGKGSWWNSALVAAVAKLITEREKK